jgi:hypothetical protein
MKPQFDLGDWVLDTETGQEGEVVEYNRGQFLVRFDDSMRWISGHVLEAAIWGPPAAPPKPKLEVKEQEVGFKDEPGRGCLLDRQGDEFLVQTPDGFERWFFAHELIFYDHALEVKTDEATQAKIAAIIRDDLFPGRVNRQKSADHKRVIDLHIHELLENTAGMTKHELFIFQLDTARHELERARAAGIKELTFIHGKGRGKLRQALLDQLAGEVGISVYDAKYAEFGGGAITVEIWKKVL